MKEHVTEWEKVIDKVHSILKNLDILVYRFDYELTDLSDIVYDLSDILKRNRIRNSNLDDTLSSISYKNEERHMWIKALELDIVRSKDDVINLKNDNRIVLK